MQNIIHSEMNILVSKNQIKQIICKDNEQWAEIKWFMIQNIIHNEMNSLVSKNQIKQEIICKD